MKHLAVLSILLVLGGVLADSDSSSDSSSGEHKSKNTVTEHKYNYPAYPPAQYGYMQPYPYNAYPYNQLMPQQYPNQAPYAYPPYLYNPYMQAPPPYPYPPPPNPNWNSNSPPNQQPPTQPASGPGLPTPYPQQGGSSVINHSLKVNKEYNEDGHHSSP
ncbi:hypothetical protein KR059_012371 [Drosophila kikkawai]|nr:hypothetical protein KR059_012371 [Drosophila kikkawai]